MSDPRWSDVDDLIDAKLGTSDPVLDAALDANGAAGLPAIDLSAAQGKLLHLLVRATSARRILEVGTLGGYSTTWLARALPEDGQLVTLELEQHHADVARFNLARAALTDRVELIVGPAADSLAVMDATSPFDLVFIDADKEGNVGYLREALRLTRPGATIIVDNVVREGDILDPASADPKVQGTLALYDAVAAEPRLSATVVQTVGAKKWDGFLIAVVT